jgi:hypothetical protein
LSDEDEDDEADEESDCPLPFDDAPPTPFDAGVVAGGDGVASLSTLFALISIE